MKKAANVKKEVKEKKRRRERAWMFLFGLVAVLAGLFLVVEPFLCNTLPYDELTQATVEVAQVHRHYSKSGYLFVLEDTTGVRYNLNGNPVSQAMDYDELIRAGDMVTIKYQPAYYRYENSILELWLEDQQLCEYINEDKITRFVLPPIGAIALSVGGLFWWNLWRNKKKKKDKR